MKRNFISKLLVGSILLVFFGCSSSDNKTGQQVSHRDQQVDSSIRQLTKPTNQQVIAQIPTVRAEKGLKIFPVKITGRITYDSKNNTSVSSRVSGRIEHLWIKYNYQPIRKGQLLLDLYSPELVSAQRELLLLNQTQEEKLVQSAIQKLQYLGMSYQQIQKVLQSKKVIYNIPVYSPTSGYILEKASTSQPPLSVNASTVSSNNDAMGGMSESANIPSTSTNPGAVATQPILLRMGQYVDVGQTLFSIYTNSDLIGEFALPPSLTSKIKKGKKILFHSTDQEDKIYQGEIGLVQPTFNAGENFSLARVYLKDIKLPVGQLLNGTFAVTTKQGFWLPKQAVVLLGNKSVVFKKEGAVFRPTPVQTGIHTVDKIQVVSDIQDWLVARNASYLIDSEDFISPDKMNQDE